jgi:alpha-glucosidase
VICRMAAFGCLALAGASGALAQDQQRVTSPDGQIEFRLFVDEPEPAALFRLAYQVSYHGKPLIDTSFLGLLVHNQEPVLGENLGLMSAKGSSSKQYNTLIAEYMQNGSLGRRINVEVRAYNEGIAFRYVVPESTPLQPMLLENELTEFALAEDTEAVSRISSGSRVPLPLVVEQRGIGWLAIDEAPRGTYPRMYLGRQEGNILISRLPPGRDESAVAWESNTPVTCPWRILAIGPTRESVTRSKLINSMNP